MGACFCVSSVSVTFSTATKPELLLVPVTDLSSVQNTVTSKMINAMAARAGRTMEQTLIIFLSGIVNHSFFVTDSFAEIREWSLHNHLL